MPLITSLYHLLKASGGAEESRHRVAVHMQTTLGRPSNLVLPVLRSDRFEWKCQNDNHSLRLYQELREVKVVW